MPRLVCSTAAALPALRIARWLLCGTCGVAHEAGESEPGVLLPVEGDSRLHLGAQELKVRRKDRLRPG